jgi:hypothetical protein
MILERLVHRAKLGCFDDLLALGKAECDTWGIPYRLYTPITAPGAILVCEFEVENLAKHEEFWAKWNAKPTTPAFGAKWNALIENESSLELYTVL